MGEEYILEIQNVSKEFPGIKALDDVSIRVKRGEIHGLCGENGAGKSTLMKILSGVYPAGSYEGDILFNGKVLRNGSIHAAHEKGIAIVYQELALVPQLTVGENIYLGREPRRGGIINWHKLYADTNRVLQKYKLNIPFAARVSRLGVGKQQMVEIARALSEDAEVLILDEPTSALTENEITALMEILEGLKARGITCIYISHKLEEILEITDSITVLRDGAVIGSRDTRQTNIEELISMMVGRKMTEQFPPGDRRPGEVVLKVENFSACDPDNTDKEILHNVSFELRAGEILGVAGLMGAGRTELVTTLFGEYGTNPTGEVFIKGQPVRITSARQAMHHGLSLVPEDRKEMGLVTMQSIFKNISLPNLPAFSGFLYINKHKELKECQKISKEITIKCKTLDDIVSSLSGGNQQKVVIAKWLLSEPDILFLDEPTRGIDVGAKYEIYKLMNTLAAEGVAIVMVSSELPEVLGMSDRILVMCEGRAAGIINRAHATQELIMSLATGMENSIVNKEKI